MLNFAVKHKYPLRRSAFTYADDYLQSRLDLPKNSMEAHLQQKYWRM